MKTNLEMETADGSGGVIMKPSAWQKIQIYFNMINHVMIFIVAVYMTFLCYGTGNRFISWHAWLCCLGVSKLSQLNLI